MPFMWFAWTDYKTAVRGAGGDDLRILGVLGRVFSRGSNDQVSPGELSLVLKPECQGASGRYIPFLLKAAQMVTIRYDFTPHKGNATAAPIYLGGPVRAFVGGCEQMKISL